MPISIFVEVHGLYMRKTCSFVETDGASLLFIFAEIYGASLCLVIQIYDVRTNLYLFSKSTPKICSSNLRRLSVSIFSELFAVRLCIFI